jgi:type III secretion HrpO family protein
MPQVSELASYAQQALLLSLVISLPVVAAAALVGLVVAVLQAATQVQDITLSHLPRLIVTAIVLAIAAPWMGAQIASFAARMFALG